ncbi:MULTISPECIES: hypothetical protein [Cupriavidus]
MNLITRIFGGRSAAAAPAHTVYLRPGESMPLRRAIEVLAASSDRELVAICISHYSGHIREAAIGRAVALGDSSFLDPIAARVNDWVPEVRKSATNALLTLLAIMPAQHFVAIIPRLRSLMRATRADHRAWLLEFEQRLVEAGGSAAIIDAMTCADFPLRRAAYLVARDHQLLPVAEMVRRGLLSGDIVLAQSAVTLLARVPASDRGTCIAMATASPFGPVRHAAIKFAASDAPDFDLEPLLWRAIFDSQGSLRSAAAQLLAERGQDVVGHCKAMLGAGSLSARQVRAGLSLLVERNAADVTATLAKYFDDKRADVRANALLLRARISPADKDEIALRALFDPSRKVRKAGVRLCTRGAFVTLDQISAMLMRWRDCNAAFTVCTRDQWDSLVCIALIAGLPLAEANACFDVSAALGRWLGNRSSASWTKPGGQHRQILNEPSVGARLLELAGDGRAELRRRLREAGIAI